MCIVYSVSHRGIILTLIGRSEIQLVCLFYVALLVSLHSMTLNSRYLRNVSVTKSVENSNFIELSCTIKTKVLAKEVNSCLHL